MPRHHDDEPRSQTHPASPGGREVFEILVRENADMLEAYLRSLLGRDSEIDDLFQEAMLVAYRRLGDYDRQRPFGAWLRGIARMLVLEHARKGRARPRASDPAVLEAVDQRFHLLDQREGDTFHEKSRTLLECLKRLPDAMRQSVELVHIRGLSIAQASAATTTGQEAMKKRVQRGRALLARCIGIRSGTRAEDD